MVINVSKENNDSSWSHKELPKIRDCIDRGGKKEAWWKFWYGLLPLFLFHGDGLNPCLL